MTTGFKVKINPHAGFTRIFYTDPEGSSCFVVCQHCCGPRTEKVSGTWSSAARTSDVTGKWGLSWELHKEPQLLSSGPRLTFPFFFLLWGPPRRSRTHERISGTGIWKSQVAMSRIKWHFSDVFSQDEKHFNFILNISPFSKGNISSWNAKQEIHFLSSLFMILILLTLKNWTACCSVECGRLSEEGLLVYFCETSHRSHCTISTQHLNSLTLIASEARWSNHNCVKMYSDFCDCVIETWSRCLIRTGELCAGTTLI